MNLNEKIKLLYSIDRMVALGLISIGTCEALTWVVMNEQGGKWEVLERSVV